MITAPFNFVPLSDEVFFPSWADDISHDKPMRDNENNLDSQSGEIDIKIEAKSPIFIKDSKEKEKFCQHDGQYYIPSSSIKGMIRSIVEILSFSKMSVETYNDNTYSVRDLSKSDNFYMSEMKKETYGGWLKKIDNKYYIEDCGEVGRINHSEIDKIFNIDFSSNFKKPKFINNDKSLKTAEKKHQLIKDKKLVYGFSFQRLDHGRKIYIYDDKDGKEGTLVFTGQPDARVEIEGKKAKGKGYEFIFFDKKDEYEVTHLMEKFKFAYFDGRRDKEPEESADWTFWKQKLENGEKVPVFFQKEGGIKHFGLSYLYKIPYNYSVSDGIPLTHQDERIDLAQSIFGYINDKKALKGRVSFSHFLADLKTIKEQKATTEILGTPRASYYPIYVRQNGQEYLTFMDSNFQIAGRKRYPVHKTCEVNKTTDTGNKNVGTTFTPLSQGAVFNGKLRYHNLKKAELGAILSALTFHNTPNTFHNIGLAKSLGYGKIKISIQNFLNLNEYLKEFEMSITQRVLGWSNSDQVTELLTMASEQENKGEASLSYMELSEFAPEKNQQNYLKMYSELNGIQAVRVKSLISDQELQEFKSKHQELLENEKKDQEKRKQQIKHDNEWENISKSNNTASVEHFIKKYPESKFLDKAKKRLEFLIAKENETKFLEKQSICDEKWVKINEDKNKKFIKSALEKFIEDCPDSRHINEAKDKLKAIFEDKNNSEKIVSNLQDMLNVSSIRDFEIVLKSLKKQELSEARKKEVFDFIVRLYSNENSKNKKRLFRKTNIDKIFDKNFIEDLKKILN